MVDGTGSDFWVMDSAGEVDAEINPAPSGKRARSDLRSLPPNVRLVDAGFRWAFSLT